MFVQCVVSLELASTMTATMSLTTAVVELDYRRGLNPDPWT